MENLSIIATLTIGSGALSLVCLLILHFVSPEFKPGWRMVSDGASMGLMFSGFRKAGIPLGKDAEPPGEVPKGVIAVGGYANRILVLCYIGFNLIIAFIYLKIN